MRRRFRDRASTRRRATPGLGFTLLELLLVMVIIGILLAFILTAAMDGVRRAEERATQALVAKLDVGMADRVDALLTSRADANSAHGYLAAVWTTVAGIATPTPSNARAQTIARFDLVKAELPDVFFVQSAPSGLSTPNNYYPLNFAAVPYNAPAASAPAGLASSALSGDAALFYQVMLPYGIAVQNNGASGSFGNDPPGNVVIPATTGIYGASYTVAAGLYKNLFEKVLRDNPGLGSPTPRNAGFDGIDNDNDGLIDELAENDTGLATGTISNKMKALLGNHTHKTARSEMLYAVLVEGQGPFGSVFNRDDFSDSEVRDTDGDGLPEFVDAWGEPLQFYRWPIFYKSDTQKGASTYLQASAPKFDTSISFSVSYETRQQNTLDPNQTLVDPSWWSSAFNTATPYAVSSTGPLSGSAYFIQSAFHSLTDPNAKYLKNASQAGLCWDRGAVTSTNIARREYYSRYVILSGGQDKLPGVPVFDDSYYSKLSDYLPSGGIATVGGTVTGVTTIGKNGLNATTALLQVESQAAQASPVRTDKIYYAFADFYDKTIVNPVSDPLSAAIQEAGKDDISNHVLTVSGGATQ